MTYQELRNALKQFKLEGLTTIRLNSKKEALQKEYDRIIATYYEDNELSGIEWEMKQNAIEKAEVEAKLEAAYEALSEEQKAEVALKNQSDTLSDNQLKQVADTGSCFEHKPQPVTYQPRLPIRGNRRGLLHSAVHLAVCTGVFAANVLSWQDQRKVPIVQMRGNYQPAMA